MTDYEKLSFRNLVLFYENELRILMNGSTLNLTQNKKRLLRKHGVITTKSKNVRGMRLVLTPKAERILREVLN